MGSTWSEDEQHWFPILKNLLNQNFFIIWVPHDVSRTNELIKKILVNTNSIEIIKWSENKSKNIILNKTNPVIFVMDQVGLLADLYKFSFLSFLMFLRIPKKQQNYLYSIQPK